MKKKYVIIGLLASSLASFGQRNDGTYAKKLLKTRDIDLVFSYYTQDNDHSAVTGGIGTEDLQVYATQLTVDTKKDSAYNFHVAMGVDIISSASTDNIDFVMSSASRTDARTHFNLGYERLMAHGMRAGINTGFSIESDYFSRSIGGTWGKLNNDKQREVSIAFQALFDDLRWGRLNNGKPQKLIYPSELRHREWFDTHKRNSFNIEAGIYQIINRRMALGIYPGIIYQHGVLSTPFHRVYFFDDNRAQVENLPRNRWKVPIGAQLNAFVGARMVIRTAYRFYWDDFGVIANTVSIETPIKIASSFNVSPSIRFYTQTASKYFEPYKQHSVDQIFYTSDYDLARTSSIKPGLALRFMPIANKSFREIELRYSFYKRSDGLEAHMITTYFGFKKEKWK